MEVGPLDRAAMRSRAAHRAWRTRRRNLARSAELEEVDAGAPAAAAAEAPADRTPDPHAAVLLAARRAASGAVARARKHGLPCDAAHMLDVARTLRAQDWRCATTGIPFDVGWRTAGAGGTHFSPSPDRIVPALGYVPDNVRWVLWAVNRAKGEMPDAVFLRICRAVAAREPDAPPG